jgi:hypothetical protein
MTLVSTVSAQHLSTARSVAIGAATPLASDLSSLDWNAAGLSRMSSWEFSATSYAALAGNDRSATLQTIGVGRRFGVNQAAAVRYSPGRSIEFVVPTTFIFNDSSTYFVTQFDKKISYAERFSLGYAWSPQPSFAFGAGIHYYEEQVTDTRYSIDTSSFIRASTVDYSGTAWTVDLGLLWQLQDEWRLGATVTNLVRGIGSPLAEAEAQYRLDIPKTFRAGLAYTGARDFVLAVDGDTRKLFHAGGEWRAHPAVSLRAGAYASAEGTFDVDALSLGAGGRYGNVRLDLAYLAFLSQDNRRGTADLQAFQASELNGIEYNAFTSDRLTLTATVNIGAPRASSVRIEAVEMRPEIFPASRALYAYLPVGTARVRNTGSRPVEAKVSFYVDRYMDMPTESQPYTIAPGDTAAVPFYAVLNERLASNRELQVKDAIVSVHASSGEEFDDQVQARFLVRGRNDWNGDVSILKYFVAPGDQEVLRYSRAALVPRKARLDTLPGMLQNFEKAKIVFDELAKSFQYVGDPKQTEDFVQYPSETLRLKTGDCDDMSVCYASLLGSMGISTAFIDVVPPEHPEKSHIYVMFDTGLEPTYASRVSVNPKRYVVRKNDRGALSIWIPVETTAMTTGFEDAWMRGAEEYLQEAEVQLGLVKGWVRIVDIESIN